MGGTVFAYLCDVSDKDLSSLMDTYLEPHGGNCMIVDS